MPLLLFPGVRSVIPSDCDTRDLTLVRIMGGLLASAYLRTVSLWMPNSLAIARMERPRSLACCTAFHRTLCRGVGFLRGDAGGLRTLPSAA